MSGDGSSSVRIELFVGSNEPLTAESQALIEEAASEAGVTDLELVTTEVSSQDDAKDLRCLGSPTIRVEGRDVEYGEREPPETTNGARYYSTTEGWQRLPTRGMIVFAIKEVRAGRGGG
jgi:hypothetical protein